MRIRQSRERRAHASIIPDGPGRNSGNSGRNSDSLNRTAGGTRRSRPGLITASATALALLGLAACAPGAGAGEDETAAATEDAINPGDREVIETTGPSPRLALTFDGGVMIFDAESHELIDTLDAEGFTRLNSAGDNRHLFLTEGESFRLLDMGAWSLPHGDHSHSYTTDPLLTEQRIEGPLPGHLVHHDGRTVAFFDGSGEMHTFDPTLLSATSEIRTEVTTADEPHHGVAVMREDDSMITTIGTEESRSGAKIVDADGETIAENTDCPGVHGEAAAADGIITVGCEDGLLVFEGDEITKIDAPDDYGRIGNQFGSPESPVVLGDYKTDPDAELERPTTIALADTSTGELTIVDLPAAYAYRSLARGAHGEALVMGTDGTLRVVDPESGDVTEEIAVMGEWEEPMDWQEPRPTVHVLGHTVYVSEPSAQLLHVVDIESGEVTDSVDLPEAPNEIGSVSGDVPGADGHGHSEGSEGEEDAHEHDDHAHEHDDHAHEHDDDGHAHDDDGQVHDDHGHAHEDDDHEHEDDVHDH